MKKGLPMPPMEDSTPEACSSVSIDLFLLTAVSIELTTLLSSLKPLKGFDKVFRVHWKESTYYVGTCGLYNVLVTKCEKGESGRDGATLAVIDGIDRWKPHAVIMVGFAFGLKPHKKEKVSLSPGEHADDKEYNQRMGDILISTHVIAYDIRREGEDDVIRRGPKPECGQILYNRLRSFLDTVDLKPLGVLGTVYPGPILSGLALIDSSKLRAQLLADFPDAIGGEQEGGGLYAAAERRRVEWILIKSIADWAVGKRDNNQRKSTANAVNLVVAWLNSTGLERHHFHEKPKDPHLAAAQLFVYKTDLTRAREIEKRKTSNNLQLAREIELLKDEDGAIPLKQKNLVEMRGQEIAKNIEDWLNAYNDLCSLYLNDQCDKQLFRADLTAEIREIFTIEGPQQERLLPREESPFQSIWRVWDELMHASEKTLQS